MAGRPAPLSPDDVVRAARTVLRAEHREAVLSITFMSRERIRAMNRDWMGRDQVTDVLAFALPGPRGSLAGDVYLCAGEARRAAREHGVPVREELLRLVVHGVLHVLGRHHPEGPQRVRSAMWRRQEQLVRRLG